MSRRSLVARRCLCTFALGHDDDLDEHKDEDLGSAERWEGHPLVEAEDNNEMEVRTSVLSNVDIMFDAVVI
jgi:hypothetical protein